MESDKPERVEVYWFDRQGDAAYRAKETEAVRTLTLAGHYPISSRARRRWELRQVKETKQ